MRTTDQFGRPFLLDAHRVAELYRSGCSIAEIGSLLNTTPAAVRVALDRLNVPKRLMRGWKGRLRKCDHCGEEYVQHRNDQLYCSVHCKHVGDWAKTHNTGPRSCLKCGKTFTPRRFGGNAEYCSAKCWKDAHPNSCLTCGALCWGKPNGRFCSDTCRWYFYAAKHGLPKIRPGCEYCGGSMWHKIVFAKFCSDGCRDAYKMAGGTSTRGTRRGKRVGRWAA
jgi:hypothetical protein